MKAKVDDTLCSGCGVCIDICPEVFDMNDDGDLVIVTVETVPVDAEDNCRDAADQCPCEAIEVEA